MNPTDRPFEGRRRRAAVETGAILAIFCNRTAPAVLAARPEDRTGSTNGPSGPDQHRHEFHRADLLARGPQRARRSNEAAIGEAMAPSAGSSKSPRANSRAMLSRWSRLRHADIQFGHVLYRLFSTSHRPPDRPALRRYYERLAARPAFAARHGVLEELRGSLPN